MNSSERLLCAFRRETPDRVPVATWLSLRFLNQLTGQSPKKFLDRFAQDPADSIVKIQEDLGLDPILITFSELEDEVTGWPSRFFRWEPEAFENWHVETTLTEQSDDSVTVQRTVTAPSGQLTSAYRRERYQKWTLEHLVKEESDLELLKYRPDPKYLDVSPLAEAIRKAGTRALVLHNFPGVWYEACSVRDLVSVATDVYERPEWLKQYIDVLGDYLLRLLARVLETGVQVILLDESWVGVGLSAATFNEYILPYDAKLVALAHEAGAMVDYHNCGRIKAVLEPMADTGADVLEPLLPPSLNGELWLKDIKQRVGRRLALYGGFNERVLQSDDPEEVRREVRRCIDEGAAGGGYAIRTAGQVFDATVKNIEAMTDEVRRYGRYG